MNNELKKKYDIIYFGPMGCRTGFYLLVRNLDNETVFMSDDSDADETVELTEFADLSDLQARMNHFVTTHTKSTLF